MTDSAPTALRRHFARHNRRVVLLALFTALLVLLFWATIYFVVYWLVLLAISVAQGVDAQMPPFFFRRFVMASVILCVVGFIARRFSQDDRARDSRSIPGIAADVVLAVPRATLSVWGTLAAFQFLNERELALAWRVLQVIGRDGRLNVHTLPVEIPDPRLQRKIVLALQLADLIDFRKLGGEFAFTFRNDAARALCQPAVRMKLG